MAAAAGSGFGLAGGDEAGEFAAGGPEEEKGHGDDGHHDGVEELLAAEDEGVVGEDVEDDGAEDEEAEVAQAGDGDEEAADDFEGFDHGEVAGGLEGGPEVGPGGARRRGGRGGADLEEIHRAGGDEEEAEQTARNVGRVFHGWWDPTEWRRGAQGREHAEAKARGGCFALASNAVW